MAVVSSRAAEAAPCVGPLGREAVIECALSRSLEVRQARQEMKVIAGRRIAAGIWLPSNPVISGTVAHRVQLPSTPNSETALNWYLTLSQEIEIGGQRSARLDVADAEGAAQIRRVAVAEQEQIAQALVAYYDILATKEALVLASEVAKTADALGAYAAERVKEALMAPVDADLLRAESVRVGLLRFEAERRYAAATTLLATILGTDPVVPLELTGTLDPPTQIEGPLPALVDRALTLRGELAAAEMERQMWQAQLRVWRRSRAPNLTLFFNAQNDGLNEQVLGGGISLPIPLPAPVGRTYAGEIAETRARIQQAETSVEMVRRRVKQETAQSWANLQSRAGALKLFSGDVVSRARADLNALREGLATRQLSVREALLAQRNLIELLLANIEARSGYAFAWVELMRVAGLRFQDVNP